MLQRNVARMYKPLFTFANQVVKNKENYSSVMVKKANFAKNVKKWNH